MNPSRIALCALAVSLLPACQNVPKYKKSSGKFNEWQSYEGKHFEPSTGAIAAIDPAASTVTIVRGKDTKVFSVTSATRIMHEGDDITLAQLPLQTQVKYTLSEDGQQLLTVWYGHRRTMSHPATQHQEKTTFF